MKVLFALNDESITHAIVKQYTDQYKEIISYKNVYFFKAILTELAKNKTYDRIVISEDLEEFTSSSLNQKDKFIFDQLDNISDEAVSGSGVDIPIILICSERRTKSEDILVKLFGIGIYNAIIGDDRTTEKVCRLINKPRSKKEAKIYYKIDSENVNYEKEDDSNVNEMEIQTILRHFKRLGKNEDKYVESFEKIVSQYNDSQLKVIIAVLPENVKEVLSLRSEEYKRIMVPKNKGLDSIEAKTKQKKSSKKKTVKGTSEKLLGESKGLALSRPVIVPSNIEKNIYTKVNKVENSNLIEDTFEEDEDEIEDDVKKILEEKPKKRGRGRPRKNPLPEEKTLINEAGDAKKVKNSRKRDIIQEDIDDVDDVEENSELDLLLPGIGSEEEEFENNNRSENSIKEYDDEYDEEYDEDYDEENDEKIDDYSNTVTETNENYTEDEEYDEETEDEEYNQDSINNYATELENNNQVDEGFYLNNRSLKHYDNVFKEGEIDALLAGDKKMVAFVGTSKNGTSFIVNNIAQILSNKGINTAILDATQNKNDFYIYTKNDEDLRKTAIDSIEGLKNGEAKGVLVNTNLTVYTTIPRRAEDIYNSHPIVETLLKNHSIVLIDCDFNTPIEYFENSQEIYLIQTMDVLTIQALTEFLRELQVKNALVDSKIRIVLNKMFRLKGISGKNIINGMSKYNDPEMMFMKDLFDTNLVKTAGQIPFNEDVYMDYLEGIINCEIKTNRYPKEFKQRLNELADNIYPLLPNDSGKKNKKNKKNYANTFSSDMNNTLDNMRKRY